VSRHTTTKPDIRIRVYEAQVDDSSKTLWFAEAGTPVAGMGWSVFAESPCGEKTREAATEALYSVLYWRWRKSEHALKQMMRWTGEQRLKRIATRIARLFSRGGQ
jgi:hypothetical protein